MTSGWEHPSSTSPFLPTVRLRERLARSANHSDEAFLFDVLAAAEMLLKVTVAGLVAAIRRDPAGHQYRLEATLVRADGVGDWVRALEELLTGPASEYLAFAAQDAQRQLTETVVKPDWRKHALELVDEAAGALGTDQPGFRRAQLRQFFSTFAWIRNKTRGHGAPDLDLCGRIAEPLSHAVQLLGDGLVVGTWPWATIKRGISGRFRVTELGNGMSPSLTELTRRTDLAYDDGIYVGLETPMRVRLAASDIDVADFYLANGSFTQTSYEALSYGTGERRPVPSAPYLAPPAPLPPSETGGTRSVGVRDNVLTNMPSPPAGYVSRFGLEAELRSLLIDERRPVVTLGGRGGIGKTSLALQVLDAVAKEERFGNVWWFSARDIDLLPVGPKQVRPDVVTIEDIAREFVRLIASDTPGERRMSTSDAMETFGTWLSSDMGAGNSLFVFDNFETVAGPGDAYRWLDDCVRLPNKVLITTRVRDFRGDYPVEVGGMTDEEFTVLVRTVSEQLGIEGLVNQNYIEQLYAASDGHPYVAKILLGEVARTGRPATAERIMAAREDILIALFERTFTHSLSPAAQRIFLTLCAWRSVVAELAIKAAVIRPGNERLDVSSSIDELVRSSMVEAIEGPETERFISVPLAAQLFGRSKLRVAADKASIDSDLVILRAFGAAQESDVARGLAPRIDALLSAARQDFDGLRPTLEYVATHYAPLWLRLAEGHAIGGDTAAEHDAVARYVESRPLDPIGWRRLAKLAAGRDDSMAEMNALVQLADLPVTPYREISEIANRFNYLSANKRFGEDAPAKQVLAERLQAIMQRRIAEADATDLSRLGWLCLHLSDHISAAEYARRGLAMESTNRYCRDLLERSSG